MYYKFYHKGTKKEYSLTMDELEAKFIEYMKYKPIAYFNNYNEPLSAVYDFIYNVNGLNSCAVLCKELESTYLDSFFCT